MSLRASDTEPRPEPAPTPETLEAVERGHLRFITDRSPGWTRRLKNRRLTVVDNKGKLVQTAGHLKRIEALKIPPAWTQVWICPFIDGHIQVTGRDAKGRKQYLYHPEWRRVRDETKFVRMRDFGEKLPSLRRRLRNDLKKKGLPRDKVLAAVVSLMDRTLVRIGNEEYAKSNGSYGLTTFRNRHASVRGAKVRFHFKGKSGKVHDIELEDPKVARVIRRCQELPGQDLFEYVSEDGAVTPITSSDVNEYLRSISGEDFTAKDFRTWGGSTYALRSLLKAEHSESQRSKSALTRIRQRTLSRAYKETSIALGNTVAVCKKYYVHPSVVERHLTGDLKTLCSSAQQRAMREMSSEETLLLRLLKSESALRRR